MRKKSAASILKARIAELTKLVGGFSNTSKMPCESYSISAKLCKMGSTLRAVENSVCSKCYALKGYYVMYKNTAIAMENRLKAMMEDPNWTNNMIELLSLTNTSGYFRWFDSGDIQSLENLKNIVKIAEALPHIKFWLPTKEYSIVFQFIKEGNTIPFNLNIRLSAYMIDAKIPEIVLKNGLTSSSVVSKESEVTCPSSKQGGKCLTCRLCWDKNNQNVAYKKH